MRLRVRVGGQTGRLELEGENPTLGELRALISTSLLPSLGYSSSVAFGISLNGNEALTEDEESLESLGIRSGDLIYLMMPAGQHAAPPPLPVPRPTPAQVRDSIHTKAPETPNHQGEESGAAGWDTPETPGPSSSSGPAVGEEEAEMEAPVSPDWMLEPILVCESTAEKIPHSLESLYLSAGCTSATDAMMVVIHLLMLETGYTVQGTGGKGTSMPEAWQQTNGVYKIQYSHPLGGESAALLACVPMGRLLIVNVTLSINNGVKCVKKLQIPTHSYINFPGQEGDVSSVFRDLQKLSRVVKDQLIYPLLAATRQALELPDVFGLLVLPPELKLRIFRLLDVRSLLKLSATCKELHTDIEDQSLWKYLYRRDFRDTSTRSPETNWMGLYTVMYEARKSQIRRIREGYGPAPRHPFIHKPMPSPFVFPPGIIGGDYDQQPVLPFSRDPASLIIPGMRRPPTHLFQPLQPPLPPLPGILPPSPPLPGILPPRRRDYLGGFI